MLINQDRISIRIHRHKTCRSGAGFIGFAHQLHTLRFQFALQLTNVGKFIQFIGIAVPSRIKGQNVLFEHPLKKTDNMIGVLKGVCELKTYSYIISGLNIILRKLKNLQACY